MSSFYFTRDPAGLAEMFAVSTSVGSGKTKAAIQYMASPAVGLRNFIYVAPTVKLIQQTERNLLQQFKLTGSPRGLHMIHSQARTSDIGSTGGEVLAAINEAPANIGRIVICTTVTFLDVVSKVKEPQHWSVIMDEAFSPVEFVDFPLGIDPKPNLITSWRTSTTTPKMATGSPRRRASGRSSKRLRDVITARRAA